MSIFLAAITWLVFGQTLRHEFVNYDDGSYVYGNARVLRGLSTQSVIWAFTHVHSQNWHPVTTISHMLDCTLFGLNAHGHHLINVLLHTVVALLLFRVLREMTGNLWRSAFVAAVFAIHPLRAESVAWIAERKDVLSGLFLMLTLSAYTRYARDPSRHRYLTMSIWCALGLMSKPMFVAVPLVLLLLDYWPLGKSEKSEVGIKKLIVEKIPLFLMSAATCLATIIAQKQATGSTVELPLLWRVNNAIVTYVVYIWQMFWPANLAVYYPHPENRLSILQVAGAAVFLIGMTLLVIKARRARPYLFTGWFWYLIMLAPVSGIVQVGLQGHADRYTYLPHIGLYVLVTWSVAEMSILRARREVLFGLSAAVLLVLGVLSWRQTTYWKNSETLWTHALAVVPDSDVAYAGLGGALLDQGKPDEAIAHLQESLKRRPGNAEAHSALGGIYFKKGDTAEAIVQWRKSLELQPEDVQVRDQLGQALGQLGHLSEAMTEWRKSLEYDPDDANALNNLAWVLAAAPQPGLRDGLKALEFAQRAIRMSGERNALIFRTLAAAYAENGRFPEAIATAKRGSQLASEQKNVALRDELDRNVQLYETGVPFRDSGLHDSAP